MTNGHFYNIMEERIRILETIIGLNLFDFIKRKVGLYGHKNPITKYSGCRILCLYDIYWTNHKEMGQQHV